MLVPWCAASNAADGQASTTRTVILQPGATPGLRVDFNYNFQNALPPFAKEPVTPGKVLARGLIPTAPPTYLLRIITDNQLLLNLDHEQDFVIGNLVSYRSTYNGHVFFRDLQVTTVRDGLTIPYALDLFTYEVGFAGWVHVRSGWTGQFDAGGSRWRLAVEDNLDGLIGAEDTLYLASALSQKNEPMMAIRPVPKMLFIGGQGFNLSFAFKSTGTNVALEASFSPTNPPLATLRLAAQGCRYVRLGDDQLAVILEASSPAVAIPAGSHKVTGCVLEPLPGAFRQPDFIQCDRQVAVAPDCTTSLEIGLPLSNTVQVVRDRNLLKLTYHLRGQAGEQYEYYDWRDRPRFVIHKGPLKIGGGSLPFG